MEKVMSDRLEEHKLHVTGLRTEHTTLAASYLAVQTARFGVLAAAITVYSWMFGVYRPILLLRKNASYYELGLLYFLPVIMAFMALMAQHIQGQVYIMACSIQRRGQSIEHELGIIDGLFFAYSFDAHIIDGMYRSPTEDHVSDIYKGLRYFAVLLFLIAMWGRYR